FPMDLRLRSIMKNTKASINVFRVGVGGSFDEYDNYRYYFPLSDRYCNINAKTSETDIRVERYMNYLGYDYTESKPATYDAENIGECMETTPAPEPQFRFGHDVPVPTMAGDVSGDRYEYKFDEYFKMLYSGQTEDSGGSCTDTSDLSYSAPYRKLDKAYYRKWLAFTNIETTYAAGRAPYECASPIECYSSSCSFDFYSRGTNLKKVGDNLVEFMADCNAYGTSGGKTTEVCAPTTGITPGSAADPVDYATTTLKLAKIRIKIDGYDSTDIMQVEEQDIFPGDCPDVHTDQWSYKNGSCIGDCGDTGADNRCELRREWCDFSGNDLGAYECGNGAGVLDFYNADMVVGLDITIEKMPAGITITSGVPKSECPQLYGVNSETTEVDCPTLVGSAYPPAGGFVFFGKTSEPEKRVMWTPNVGANPREVIGYGFGDDNLVHTLLGDRLTGCNLNDLTDYARVEIGPPNGAKWQQLMDAFTPLFEERMDGMAGELGDDKVASDGELIISSIPWVLAYKPYYDNEDDSYMLSSVAAQKLREKNIFDLPTPNALDTNAAGLDADYGSSSSSENLDENYLLVYPKYIYLFFAPSEGRDFGQCAYDEALGMPSLKPYGWCEPCTISTIAYQNITAGDWAYLPRMQEDASESRAICSCDTGDFKCFSPTVTDVEDYDGADLMDSGSPRTQPEAFLMKERLGDYMKAAVLPVIDMTDESNWEKTRPSELGGNYEEYDFERLFGDMGSVVVIVDTVDKSQYIPVPAERLEEISERSAIVRTHCWRCMTAVRLSAPIAPFTDARFEDALTSLFSDSAIRKNIDIVAFDYSPQITGYGGYYTTENLSDDVLNHLSSRSRKVLQIAQKPSIALNFYISTESSFWTDERVKDVLGKLADNQDTLADAGLMGFIWMPARGETDILGTGIVDTSSGVGDQTTTFCAVQKGMNDFANPSPLVIYSRVAAVDAINCSICTAYEKSMGACNKTCGNGVECGVPEGYPASIEWTCPAGTFLNPCQLCNESLKRFVCTYNYYNGTIETRIYEPSYISSDLYMDVLAGLETPDKCCIESPDGTRYSYNKQVFSGLRTIPIVFPKSGTEGASCAGGRGLTGEFCGVEVVPTANYD
ncbi:hypothetical protein H0O02_05510, partial [Candidatus Micrarchaeota archaeon]|nr:hypothetical protein [Candidatus Micrarchaeota archaeon]